MCRTQEMGHNISTTWIIYANMHIRNTFLINVECKSQITNIPLRRLNLIACITDLIGISISPTDKENVIMFKTQ